MNLKLVTGHSRRQLYSQFLVGTSLLLLSIAGASALTPAETAIQAKLPSGVLLLTTKVGQTQATEAQVDTATKLAITGTHAATATTVAIVQAGVKYAPLFAADLTKAGLDNLQSAFPAKVAALTGTPAQILAKTKSLTLALQLQTGQIVTAAMNATLTGSRVAKPVLSGTGIKPVPYAGVGTASDGAAAVTALAVNSVKGAAANTAIITTTSTTTLLQVVVTNAVRTAATHGVGDVANGAGGAVTGAISQIAGTNNSDITNGDANDLVVIKVIQTATKAAPSHVSEIAKAVGYAFASTYLKTFTGGQVASTAFVSTNLTALALAIQQGLNPTHPTAVSNTIKQVILNQITSGIALAYAGLTGPGVKGVNNFAYNNSNGSPVTDVTGL